MRKALFIMLSGIFCALTQPMSAQITAPESLVSDTLVLTSDTLELTEDSIIGLDPDPEWYVAPDVLDDSVSLRAPMRAAASCPVDSICTFNIDSVLTEVTVYEYGDTTRTMVWTVNANGSRVGKSRTEEASTSTSSYSATYAWDNTANNWKGTTKTEKTFASGKETVRIIYNTWLNNNWVADTKYTWVYDASGREIEYTTYTRNTSTNQLVLSKQRIREWYNASKMTLDIQYTAHNGTTWSAGTKKMYAYDASANQIEYTYYSSLSNGNWVGSTHEVWEYTSGKKTYYEKQTWSSGNWVNSAKEIWAYNGPSAKQTLYEKYTWSNGAWVGSSKEIWEYNGPSSKQTLHEKYGWANGNWSISLQENLGYDDAGNNNLVLNYTITSGTWKGSKKEEYTYNAAKKKTQTIKYKWSNNDWVYNTRLDNDYDAAGNTTETANYLWNNDAWKGTGTRTLTTYNSSNKEIEKITQTWPSGATDWVNATRKTTEYEGTRTTQEASFTWSTTLNDWVGTSRSDWHYNTAGQNDTIKTYTPNGTEWIFSSRTVKTYDAKGNTILTHNASWNGTSWVMTSMTKLDLIYDGSNRQLLRATWQCGADSMWTGIQKDTAAYTASGKKLFTAVYDSWANNDWVAYYKVEYEYDTSDRKILEQRFDWNVNAWKGNYRNEIGYDDQGREILTASYTGWNNLTGTWIGSQKTEKTYGANNQIASTIMSVWGTNTWRLVFRYLYTYDASGREIVQTVEHFENNAWVYTEKYEKEYSGNTQVKDNSYIWLNNKWVFSSRNESYYDNDAQAKLRRQITGSWNNGVLSSFADKYYDYACDPHSFTIRFVNYNGTELSSETVEEGTTPTYKGENPTREATPEYTYSFDGWTPAIAPATTNITYTATYTATKRSYTITWLNEDGSQIDQTTVKFGETPAHADMSKVNTAEYTYEFIGWTPGIGVVTGDATYKATFSETKNKYTITWLNDNDTQIDQTTVAYGEVPTHADATKTNTAEWTYTFKGWNPEIIAVNGNATYKATYTATKNKYTVVFQDEGGAELQSGEVEYGTTPTYEGEKPHKDADVQYTYSFSGWEPEITAVEGAQTYTAKYSSTVNKYTIKWLNDDDSELQSSEVEYGTTPTYEGETPHKDADEQYTYTFAGWDKEILSVTGEATYKATYSSTTNQYTVKFVNYNGDELQSSSWNYGATPSYSGETPTKPADDENNYTFEGWSPVVSVVTKDATYTATYTKAANEYTITWYNDDNTLIDQTTVAYGVVPTHADPTKENTAEWTYTFSGWDHEPVAVTGNASYTATYNATKNKYLVVFQDEGGTELQSGEVEYGTMPVFTGTQPSKEATAQYTYSFNGWDPEITAVEGAQTYTAKYSSTVNKYTIKWLNDDDSELQSSEVEYGTTPTYEGETPHKDADEQYTYTFAGWDQEILSVTGEATYKATYTKAANEYTITWYNDDNTIIDQTTVAYGVVPTHEDPTKENTAEWTYTFSGWDHDPVAVTGNASYTATYNATKNKYLVVFQDEGGTELQSGEVEYGTTPEFTGAEPSKEATAQYTYSFNGWDSEITAVEGAQTYTATYSSTINKYTIKFLNDDESELQISEVEYGTTPTYDGEKPHKDADEQYTYTFAGWDSEPVAVTGEATYKATYSSTTNQYTVKFLNYDGEELQSSSWNYGAMPSYSGETPTKPADDENNYTFEGWSPVVTVVTKDATYTATYTKATNEYTISWFNDNNTIIDQTTVAYGVVPTHDDPTKENTAEWTYTFSGWDHDPVAVIGNASYTATYNATKNKYLVVFQDEGGTELQSGEVEYGTTPEFTGTEPSKEATAQYTYTFSGWDPEITAVEGAQTYTAKYSSTVNSYTITWLNEDGSEIEHETLEYGTTPQHEDLSKENTAEWTYTFTGWTPAIESVKGDASYKATFSATKNSYTITWLNEDGDEIEHETLEYGVTPSHADIYKESTEEFTYTFIGWTPSIVPVNGDAAYKAVFEATPVDPSSKTFTITFLHDDGITILEQVTVEYGEIPVCRYTPTKMGDAEHYYTFVGWGPEIVPATANASYTPLFELVARQYVITFKNYDGKVLQTTKVDYGAIPEYTGATPTRNGTTQYAYVFTGWTPELAPVTKEATYKATFERTARIYTVIYYDEDGETELDRVEVAYGQMPHTSVVPTKEEDEEYYYVFIGWTPYVTFVTKDASYSALFQKKNKLEGIEDVESEEQAVKIFKNNILYILRAGKIYTVDGKLVEGF